MGKEIGGLGLDALEGRPAGVGCVALAGGEIGDRLDLVLEFDPVDVRVDGQPARVEHRAELVVGRFLRDHLVGRIVDVERADVGHQEALGVFGVDGPARLDPVVRGQEGQDLGRGRRRIGRLDRAGDRQGRRVHINFVVHVFDAGRDLQVVRGAPFELPVGLPLVPSGIFQIGDVQGLLAGAVVGFARRAGLRQAVAPSGARQRGGLFTIVGTEGQQVDVEAVAVGLGELQQHAGAEGAEAQVVLEAEGVAAHPVVVELQIARDAEGLGGRGVA